jgi:hypothetical protein
MTRCRAIPALALVDGDDFRSGSQPHDERLVQAADRLDPAAPPLVAARHSPSLDDHVALVSVTAESHEASLHFLPIFLPPSAIRTGRDRAAEWRLGQASRKITSWSRT